MAWRIFAGGAWWAAFLLIFPKILESMNEQETVFTIGMWLLLMLICFGAGIATFVAEDEEGESVLSVIRRRRRPRWRRY